MAIFGDYACYYNLLYADKKYDEEVNFILHILARHGCRPTSLLDLGCGTARHALHMSGHGIAVSGADMSATMLAMGENMLQQEKARPTLPPGSPLPELHLGDARSLRLGRQFDAVTSLFHVMSYQTTEDDALALFSTAREHLHSGGLFFFDFWHGPGVLREPPETRLRIMEDTHTRITRHAHPVHRVNDDMVEVHYDIELENKDTGKRSRFSERHDMRYWFLPELRHLAHMVGFVPVSEGAWPEDTPPQADTWNAWMVVRKC